MAIFHLSVKTISRSAGRSATAAAAYRAAAEIKDERTGQLYDYTRKTGVLHSEIILPGGRTAERAEFWNSIELHHKRGDAVVAREVELSLPAELSKMERQELAVGFAKQLADRYGVGVDVALHAPRNVSDKDLEKDPDQYCETDPDTGQRHNGNWHAHIMLSACYVTPEGLGKKAVELDPIHCQRAKIENMADSTRMRWSDAANAALQRSGKTQRIDHRSHVVRGVADSPSVHLGHAAAGYERRTGRKSHKRVRWEQEIAARLERAKELGELERRSRELDRSIIDLSADLSAALSARDQAVAEAGVSDFRMQFLQSREGRQKAHEAFMRFKSEQQRRAENAEIELPTVKPKPTQADIEAAIARGVPCSRRLMQVLH